MASLLLYWESRFNLKTYRITTEFVGKVREGHVPIATEKLSLCKCLLENSEVTTLTAKIRSWPLHINDITVHIQHNWRWISQKSLRWYLWSHPGWCSALKQKDVWTRKLQQISHYLQFAVAVGQKQAKLQPSTNRPHVFFASWFYWLEIKPLSIKSSAVDFDQKKTCMFEIFCDSSYWRLCFD